MTIQKWFVYLLLTSLAVAAKADAVTDNDVVHVIDPYARAASKVMPNAAAYMILHNHGKTSLVLTGARSVVATRSTLHQSLVTADGMMKMLPVKKLIIPPNAIVQLQPGGYHIMLMGLKHELKEGDHFTLFLQFADGNEQRVEVPVRGVGAMPMQHQHPAQVQKLDHHTQPAQGG